MTDAISWLNQRRKELRTALKLMRKAAREIKEGAPCWETTWRKAEEKCKQAIANDKQ